MEGWSSGHAEQASASFGFVIEIRLHLM